MKDYTEYLAHMGPDIRPEDEDFRARLLEVNRSFRTFDAALDEFIARHGYTGKLSDTDAKIGYIRRRFSVAAIPIDTRIIKKWFLEHKRGTDRNIAFQFCFAFGLNLDETQSFFRQVYLQRGIDCHDIREAIYYYCISHGMSYTQAQALIDKAPEAKKGNTALDGDVLFTGSIIKELDRFRSADELMAFLSANREQFGYNNATAYSYLNQLWTQISAPDGLANREEALRHPKREPKKNRSVWEVYLQIFGYLEYDENDSDTPLFPMENDRTLRPLLKENDLIHPVAGYAFPDRQGLEGILRGVHQSFETVRKTMILLSFYRFWAALSVKEQSSPYYAKPLDLDRCRTNINRLLTDSGYPMLYEGNPFDWIFLYAAQDDAPLETFRAFMQELYSFKQSSPLQ